MGDFLGTLERQRWAFCFFCLNFNFLKIVVEILRTGVDILKTGVATLNCEACPPPSKIDVNCWCFNEMSALVSLWLQDYS